MYSRNRILKALFGRVGFAPGSTNDGFPAIDGENTESRSGYRFQDFSPVVTIRNIFELFGDFERVLTAEELNGYLKQLQQGAIYAVCDAVLGRNDVVDKAVSAKVDFDFAQKVAGEHAFVGYQVNLARSTDKTVVINKVSMLFDADKTFNLYLFSENSMKPIQQIEVSVRKNEIVAISPDWRLSYGDTNCDLFYIGYFQDDAPNPIYAKSYRKDKSLCFGFSPCQIGGVTPDTFSNEQVALSGKTFGIIPTLTAYRDFTVQVEQSVDAFDTAIGYQVAINAIDAFINTSRSNKTARIKEEQLPTLLRDLNQANDNSFQFPFAVGLKKKLERELLRLRQCFFPKPEMQTNTVEICSY